MDVSRSPGRRGRVRLWLQDRHLLALLAVLSHRRDAHNQGKVFRSCFCPLTQLPDTQISAWVGGSQFPMGKLACSCSTGTVGQSWVTCGPYFCTGRGGTQPSSCATSSAPNRPASPLSFSDRNPSNITLIYTHLYSESTNGSSRRWERQGQFFLSMCRDGSSVTNLFPPYTWHPNKQYI